MRRRTGKGTYEVFWSSGARCVVKWYAEVARKKGESCRGLIINCRGRHGIRISAEKEGPRTNRRAEIWQLAALYARVVGAEEKVFRGANGAQIGQAAKDVGRWGGGWLPIASLDDHLMYAVNSHAQPAAQPNLAHSGFHKNSSRTNVSAMRLS